MTPSARAKPSLTPMRRGQLPKTRCRHHPVDGPERPSGRNAYPLREHPIKHHVAGPGVNPWSRTEVSPGARAQTPSLRRAHAPPDHPLDIPTQDK
jgi:hypothetical protein